MALIKEKLGKYIELLEIRNSDLRYGVDEVRGVNTSKQMMPTKADLNNRDLSKFQIVEPGVFFFNHRTSRNGSKFSVTYNDTDSTIICTEDYVVFRISEYGKKYILPEWLYMFFNRPEFDRYVITNSWGSSTEFYNWDDLCDVDMELPPLSVQQKYVAIYNAMIANQQSYERGLEDLKLVCDAYIEDLRRKMPCSKIGAYISESNKRNTNLEVGLVQGVNSTSTFDETKANMTGIDLHNYKIVRTGQFAYNPSRINLGSIALLRDKDCIISPMYTVFEVKDKDQLIPDYLMMWFSRKEFQRSTLFYASGSVRDTFDFYEMQEVKIPIPDISIQKAIAEIFTVYNMRKQINERLKSQIKDICPILIKGSLEECEE
ncbi:restriction endonuclease subunit S [uncultured Ruminococcus sp.]|uniref:restriction endonuclease subunit S n=1 Tax=uncultured Ruminococcus sp. TaxID=165186 RepID=UPI00260097BA|nr:restriction endonuclease subunit S [uncultured Ruminococcus sp.]